MNPRYTPASHTTISPMAADTVDFQDLYSLGMERAIEIETASLATLARLNSCACDIYTSALSPATNAIALYMELQKWWLTMMLPHANQRSEYSLDLAAPSSTVASGSGTQTQPTAEILERSMDIVVGGLETPTSTIAGSSGLRAQDGNRARAQTA